MDASDPRKQDDAGFGLVEIIVSILMLALLATAFAPVLIGSIRTMAKMSTIATATQDANRALEEQRAMLRTTTTCALTAPSSYSLTDSRGLGLTRTVSYDTSSCASSKLVTVRVLVKASANSANYHSGQTVVDVSTLVYAADAA
ncbi:type II secretion system protein [Sanguibacter massiliensis]|uniref:type II secretion system protein n=1 Tax=Sanguibacter massiliensis TaxID=1973217 RepID=UPI000C8426C4|nr:type II secretion system protein [Sanguibacter massiliensis]